MSLKRIPSGRADITNKVFNILANDEQIMRFLTVAPELNALSGELDMIVDTSEKSHMPLARKHIVTTPKFDELVDSQICMLFLHLGKRRPVFGNALLVKQELLIDVLVHNEYQQKDYRLDDICDRLDYLLVHENIAMGKVEISNPLPMEAPKEYSRYQMRYRYFDKAK